MSQLPMMEDPAPNGSARRSVAPALEPALVDLRPAERAETPSLVLVLWHDAWSDPDQACSEDWRTDYPVRTVGFLVRRDPNVISIAQEILPDDDGFRSVTHIPRTLIESMTPLAGLPSRGDASPNGHAKRKV